MVGRGLFRYRNLSGWFVGLGTSESESIIDSRGTWHNADSLRWPADEPIPADAQAELDRLGIDRDGNQLIDVPEDVWASAKQWESSSRIARFVLSLARREPKPVVEWRAARNSIGNTYWSAKLNGEIAIIHASVINDGLVWSCFGIPPFPYTDAGLEAAKATVERLKAVRP